MLLSVSMCASAQNRPPSVSSSSATALLDRLSKQLPLDNQHNVDYFQAVGNFFQDAMVLPHLVQLPVALRAKMQWVTSSVTEKDISISRLQIIISFKEEEETRIKINFIIKNKHMI